MNNALAARTAGINNDAVGRDCGRGKALRTTSMNTALTSDHHPLRTVARSRQSLPPRLVGLDHATTGESALASVGESSFACRSDSAQGQLEGMALGERTDSPDSPDSLYLAFVYFFMEASDIR